VDGEAAGTPNHGDGRGPHPPGHDADRRKPEETEVPEHGGSTESDWLGGELRRLYRSVATEPVPDQLLSLLDQLDDTARGAGGSSGNDADDSSAPARDETENRS